MPLWKALAYSVLFHVLCLAILVSLPRHEPNFAHLFEPDAIPSSQLQERAVRFAFVSETEPGQADDVVETDASDVFYKKEIPQLDLKFAPPPAEPKYDERPVALKPLPMVTAQANMEHASPGAEGDTQEANPFAGTALAQQNAHHNAAPGAVQNPGSKHGTHGAELSQNDTNEESKQSAYWKAYTKIIAAILLKSKFYPALAMKSGTQGVVILELLLLRDGSIQNPRVYKSSGSPVLDQAALQALAMTPKLPPFPKELSASQKLLRIPYHYRLRTD